MCTRVLWNNPSRGIYCGRNMDWAEDIGTNMWALPRGQARSGQTQVNPLTWTSRYGSLVLTAHDIATADGINEAGLSVSMLFLHETSTGPRDANVPGLCIGMWAQWYLDLFATVADAVEATRQNPFQIRMAVEPHSGKEATVHLALQDPTGDSAVLECIDGEIRIYHSPEYAIMTNDPPFDQQLEHLREFERTGEVSALPGSTEPDARFVRSAHYHRYLPPEESERLSVAALMSVMRNAAAPFGLSYDGRPDVSTTRWRTITNLTEGTLYYDSVVSPSVFWVNAFDLDYSEGSTPRKLQIVDNFELAGDAGRQFQPAEMFTFAPSPE